jgi:hypothetical protein
VDDCAVPDDGRHGFHTGAFRGLAAFIAAAAPLNDRAAASSLFNGGAQRFEGGPAQGAIGGNDLEGGHGEGGKKLGAEFAAVRLDVRIHEAEKGPCCFFVHRIHAFFSIDLCFHEVAQLQFLQVMRYRSLFKSALSRKLRYVHRLLEEQHHQLHPAGVTESLEELAVSGSKHMKNISYDVSFMQ